MKKLPRQNPGKHYLPTAMTSRAPAAKAPSQRTVFRTHHFVPPIKSGCHIRRRISRSGSGPISNMPPLVKHNKLGITQGVDPPNIGLGTPRIELVSQVPLM